MVSTAPRSSAKITEAEPTVRLTVAQAAIRFLGNQSVERDGRRNRFFAGCLGIFGHGNVAGIGQALLQEEIGGRSRFGPAYPSTCSGATSRRWSTPPSPMPGRRTGCKPGGDGQRRPGLDQHAYGRRIGHHQPAAGAAAACRHSRPGSAPVLQELELPGSGDVTVNDAFKPLSRYFDRVWRPEQLPAALLGAMRVLTDPAETGGGNGRDSQDVQAEAFDWPRTFRRANLAYRTSGPGTTIDRSGGRHHSKRPSAPRRRGRWSHLFRRDAGDFPTG